MQEFISHPCCTTKLDEDWYGELIPSQNPWWFIPLALTIVFIPFYCIYKLEKFIIYYKDPKSPWIRRQWSFYQAPVTKYWIYTVGPLHKASFTQKYTLYGIRYTLYVVL